MSPARVQQLEGELAALQARYRRLAEQKSWLQLIVSLLGRLSGEASLERMVDTFLKGLVETVGGTDATLYYFDEGKVIRAGLLGGRAELAEIDDPVVAAVGRSRQAQVVEHDVADTRMTTENVGRAWSWTFPLLAGDQLVGVAAVSSLHTRIGQVASELPVFFSYVAYALKSALSGEARFVESMRALRAAHAALAAEAEAREQIAESLRRQQAFMQAVLENVTDGVVACDEAGVVSLFNRAARQLLGREAAAIDSAAWASYYELYQADGETLMSREQLPLWRAFQGERVADVEMVVGGGRSKRRRTLSSGQPMYDALGGKIGAVVTLHDQTERYRAERDLAAAKEQAEAANKAKSTFLATMSHELRTPLNAILGFSQLLRVDERLADDQRRTLDVINRSGQHLLTLINDVLQLSRIEAGQSQLELAPVDLGALIRDIMDMMQVRGKAKGLSLRLEQSSSFPRFVVTDAPKLRQILINLLANALKFSESGEVVLRLGVAEPERDDASPAGEADKATMVWEVIDSGPGIDPRDHERIFEPFAQLGQADHREGTGLGLSLCRQFVTLLGGTIAVDSALGRGTRFVVRLEVGRAQLDDRSRVLPRRSRSVALVPGQPRYRLLLVEDDAENRLLMRAMLADFDFELREAEDGLSGVEIFKQWQPDLIWMDRNLPRMSGIEATRCIRRLPGGHEVRIVAVTASAFHEQRGEMIAAGMDAVIHKPFGREELCTALAALLGVRFTFEDTALPPVSCGADALDALRLAALPERLRQALDEAVVALDIAATRRVIEEIRLLDPELATAIVPHIDGMDFQPLSEAVGAGAALARQHARPSPAKVD